MNRFASQDVKTELEMYKASINLPQFSAPKGIQNIIDALSQFKQLTPDVLTEYALDLSIYSLYLLQEENKLFATLNWCESNLKVIVGQEAPNYEGTWYKEKEDLIISSHKTAKQIDTLRCVTKVKLDTIRYMSQKIQNLAESLKRYSFDKKKMYDEPY